MKRLFKVGDDDDVRLNANRVIYLNVDNDLRQPRYGDLLQSSTLNFNGVRLFDSPPILGRGLNLESIYVVGHGNNDGVLTILMPNRETRTIEPDILACFLIKHSYGADSTPKFRYLRLYACNSLKYAQALATYLPNVVVDGYEGEIRIDEISGEPHEISEKIEGIDGLPDRVIAIDSPNTTRVRFISKGVATEPKPIGTLAESISGELKENFDELINQDAFQGIIRKIKRELAQAALNFAAPNANPRCSLF